MIVPFNPADTAKFYEQYYTKQVGDGLSVYSGRTIMDGDGLGSIFSGIARAVGPALKGFAKSAAKSVGRQALNVVGDVASGRNFRDSAMAGLHGLGEDVLGDVVETVTRGGKRKRSAPKKRGKKKQRRLGPAF